MKMGKFVRHFMICKQGSSSFPITVEAQTFKMCPKWVRVLWTQKDKKLTMEPPLAVEHTALRS